MKFVIKPAILTGLFVAIWLLAGYSILTLLSLGIPKTSLRTLTGAVGLVILFTGILYAMRGMKAKISPKGFSYFMAFKAGLVVAVITAVIVSFASFLYVEFINPNFSNDMVREAEAALKTSGATAEEISKKLITVRKEFSVPSQIIAPLIVQTIAGTIFSLVLAFFLKDKNKQS